MRTISKVYVGRVLLALGRAFTLLGHAVMTVPEDELPQVVHEASRRRARPKLITHNKQEAQ